MEGTKPQDWDVRKNRIVCLLQTNGFDNFFPQCADMVKALGIGITREVIGRPFDDLEKITTIGTYDDVLKIIDYINTHPNMGTIVECPQSTD